jgi:hypothetical protein
MTDQLSKPELVTWRGALKRPWFKREKYRRRVQLPGGMKTVEFAPKYWHAGVDIIQTRTPYPNNPHLDKVEMHVRALCGYVYTFDFILASNQYGRAMYRDSIKSNRCGKCEAELAKAPEDRSMNEWLVRPTSFETETKGEELWWPSDKS